MVEQTQTLIKVPDLYEPRLVMPYGKASTTLAIGRVAAKNTAVISSPASNEKSVT